MFTRLKRYVYAPMVVLGLWAVVLTASASVAQAQGKGPSEGNEGTAHSTVVVSPGDTLWSISEERLGPKGTPQQIAGEVERIYALNRDRIGSDPDRLFLGQELSLPATGGSSASEPATKTTPAAQQTAGLAQAAKGAAQGGRTTKGQPADQQANLPKVPVSAAVPTIGSLATDAPPTSSPVASFPENMRSAVTSAVGATVGTLAEYHTTADVRRLLGWGIIALTLLLGALMAWKLPMRRSTEDQEVWGIYPDYQGHYAHSEAFDRQRSAPRPASLGVGLEPSAESPSVNGSKTDATATEKSVSHVGHRGVAQKRRQLATRRGSKRPPRRSLAANAYSAEAHRFLRGVVLRTRAREPRNGRIKTTRRRIAGGGR